MTEALDIAKIYFEFSNTSNFEGIEKLMSSATTYSSQKTGIFLGVDSILTMQKKFHGSFKNLNWHINSAKVEKKGIVLIDYDFVGFHEDGSVIKFSGLEYLVIINSKIQHIEVRNKY